MILLVKLAAGVTLAVVLVSFIAAQLQGTVVGSAQVNDGDTVTIGSVRIRLAGIDAPELDQPCGTRTAQWPCGRKAKQTLQSLLGDQIVFCIPKETDVHKRTVALCYAGLTDIGRHMVSQGFAVTYGPRGRRYDRAQAQAISKLAGIWRGAFEYPRHWRLRRADIR